MFQKIICASLLTCILCKNITCTTDNRIIGGRPANEGEIPYQASIRRSYNDEHFCGGTLITPRHVLVAAHCMFYTWGGVLPPLVVSVVVGQLLLPIDEDSVFRNATLITIHPDFDKDSMANDLAIIELNEDFPSSNPFISTIPIRNNTLDAGVCFVSGWGVEEYGSTIVSQILLITEVNIVEFNTCQDMYSPNVTLAEGMLCAGHENGTTDACKGDSGGPLVCNGLLTGIVSTGSGCGSAEYPGIYTEVSHFLPWIQSVINSDTTVSYYHEEDHSNFTVAAEFFTNKLMEKSRAQSVKFNAIVALLLITLLSYYYKS